MTTKLASEESDYVFRKKENTKTHKPVGRAVQARRVDSMYRGQKHEKHRGREHCEDSREV